MTYVSLFKRTHRRALLIAALASLLVTSDAITQSDIINGDTFVESRELAAVLKTRNIDAITDALNDIRTMRYQGEVLPFVVDLWQGAESKYPELPWDIIKLRKVRFDIAAVLLHASINSILEMPIDDLHAYVLETIETDDLQLASEAILLLSIVDDETDVPFVLRRVAGRTDTLMRAAIVSFSDMCNPKADIALIDLEMRLGGTLLESFLRDTKAQSLEFKKQTKICERRAIKPAQPPEVE